MNWRIKGVVQKSLAAVPGGVALNDLLQRTVGGLRNFDQNVATKVNADWVVFAGHLRELGCSPRGLRFMEIGTGWYPTLPVCWHLAGAAEVITYDLQRHLSQRLTHRMLAHWRHTSRLSRPRRDAPKPTFAPPTQQYERIGYQSIIGPRRTRQ